MDRPTISNVTLIGKRIKVRHNHWIRPNALGTIISWEDGLHRWIIKFDDAKIGGGFDNGSCLCLEENDFEVIKNG